MIKIKVKKNSVPGFDSNNDFVIIEVDEQIYKIIERKVIESVTDSIEKQTLLQECKITLPKLMESCITEDMVNEAVNESLTYLKQKKL